VVCISKAVYRDIKFIGDQVELDLYSEEDTIGFFIVWNGMGAPLDKQGHFYSSYKDDVPKFINSHSDAQKPTQWKRCGYVSGMYWIKVTLNVSTHIAKGSFAPLLFKVSLYQ